MDCKEFRELLDLYLDGELAPQSMTAAQAHLAECASCERASKELLRLRRALKLSVSQYQPPEELLTKVRQLSQPFWLRLLPQGSSWRRGVTLPAPVFALLIVALVALGFWSIRLREGRMARPQANAHLPSTPAGEGWADLSRFDGGGRAVIYKVRR